MALCLVRKSYSQVLANVLLWMVGSCQITFRKIQKNHQYHHAKCADVITFDIRSWLNANHILRAIVLTLEWLFVPAVDITVRWVVSARILFHGVLLVPRGRLLTLLATRLVFFCLLGFLSPRALLLYFIGYFLFLHIIRFLDTHQHTYEAGPCNAAGEVSSLCKRDSSYEDANTYSNLISERFPLLDLLALNFAYHNIHHARPTEPWYRLPALHREHYGAASVNILPTRTLIGNYMRHRITRILSESGGEVVGRGPDRTKSFIGASAVSFLY